MHDTSFLAQWKWFTIAMLVGLSITYLVTGTQSVDTIHTTSIQ